MKLSEAYRRYVGEYLEIKGVDENQLVHFRAGIRIWCETVGDKELEKITLKDVARFKTNLKTYGRHRCENTVRNYICNLRMVLKYWKLRGEPCIDYELIPAPKREPVLPAFLTAEEVASMIDASDRVRTKLIVSLLYSSGIRISELIQLNRDSVRDGQFTVVGKGRKPRVAFCDARSEFYLKMYLSTRKDRLDALIVTKDGTRASASTIQMVVRNAAERAGIEKKVTPHTLRHSFATNFIGNNGNIRHLADMLGHASLNTTAHYTHLLNNDLRREFLKFHTC